MNAGVPTNHRSHSSDLLAARRHPLRASARSYAIALVALGGLLVGLAFAGSALAAPATVGLGTAASFSVLGGSTVTNTGPTTMFGDLGLSPGSSVTGAPHVLGQTHVDDAVAIAAKTDLTTAYNNAASRPTEGSAGTDLSGQTFTAGVRTASTSLLLSSGSVVLDAQGDPNAVFIFQIGSTLTTGSNTTVQLDQRRAGLQRLLAGRLVSHARNRNALRRDRHGRRNDHREHRGDDPRPAAREDRCGQPRHEHDHNLELRLQQKRNRGRRAKRSPLKKRPRWKRPAVAGRRAAGRRLPERRQR